MADYTRTIAGHTMTVHAPGPGELDHAVFGAFTASDPVLGLDVETSSVPDAGARQFGAGFTVRLVQFGTEHTAWVLNPADPDQRAAIEAVLGDPERRFVTFTNYDPLAVWVVFGIALGQRVADAHLLSKLAHPDERAGHGLKELAARHLDEGLDQAQQALYARMRALAPPGRRAGNFWQGWGWDHLPAEDEAYVVYAGLDAIYVRRLLPILLDQCTGFAHLARMEAWLAAQASGITIRGLLLDRRYATGLLAELTAEHQGADTVIRGALRCPGASPRFAAWLDTQTTTAGITGLARTPGGRLQVSADALAALLDRHADTLPTHVVELVQARLAMARTSNLLANLRGFLAAADPTDRIHPQIKTLRAKTARMSITGPPLQTLKKHDPRLRRCLRADPGHVLVSCDFSQVEIRVAAALSGDRALTEVIASGADIHDATATLMYGPDFTPEQRTLSKRATFGTIFGGGARALASQTGVDEDTARQVITRWRATYPGVAAYGRRLAALPEVITPSGRQIPADPARPYANANYPIQSTARDLLLAAVYTLITHHHVGGLWLFVHDEVIVQAPEHDAERVRDLLAQAMTTTFRGIRIEADAQILGPTWGSTPDTAPEPGGRVHPDQNQDGQDDAAAKTPVEPRSGLGAGLHDRDQTLGGRGRGESRAAQLLDDRTPLAVDDGVGGPVQDPHPPSRRGDVLRAALTCAARGWHVFPLTPGAKEPPLVDRWEQRASTDPAQIRRWWTRAPTANIGIATGPSGLVVVDLDRPKPGEATPDRWRALGVHSGTGVLRALAAAQHTTVTPTYTVATPSGGWHLYYTTPPGAVLRNTRGQAGWCLDTRAHGGYVVAPGSRIASQGAYTLFDGRDPVDLPGWLHQILATRPAAAGSAAQQITPAKLTTYVTAAIRGECARISQAPSGQHNRPQWIAGLALGQLIGAGQLDHDTALRALMAAAEPHITGACGCTERGVRAAIEWGLTTGTRNPRRITTPQTRHGATHD
ncbi:MAG TPA: DNA polymerase [Pseudonocardiaceae bacterium]|nr:DNA polymerase [Pseudonocardiaceae bacterium]